MKKGTNPETISSVLQACNIHGILVFVMLFIGFPGETAEEAEQTINFLLEHQPCIRHIAATRFVLEYQSPVFAQHEEFGVTPIPNLEEEDLKTFCDYTVRTGLDQDQAREIVGRLRAQPQLESLADQNVLSRTHFLFLPADAELDSKPVSIAGRLQSDHIDLFRIRPFRCPDLQALTLPFAIDYPLEHSSAPETKSEFFRGCVNYVFSPVLEKLLDVGIDGFRLLAPCDGSYSLGQILDALGGNNRETVLNFYRDLAVAGVLDWKEDP